MGSFWIGYGLLWLLILSEFEQGKAPLTHWRSLIRPFLFRGGVVIAGLQGIYAAISAVLNQ